MNINIKELTKEQLVDLQSQIQEQLNTTYFIPKGTICWVWDDISSKCLRVADGEGMFYSNGNLSGYYSTPWTNYEVIPMGISFSDEVITSQQITPEMDKMLCLCWDIKYPALKVIKIIDDKNKCSFTADGGRKGYKNDNYQLCTTPIGNLPSYYRDMIEACEE